MSLPWNPHETGDEGEKIAEKILPKLGFTDIVKPRNKRAPYDFLAKKDGKLCFIEVRYRKPTSKTYALFTFRDTKIRHLLDLNKIAPVYILLIHKYGHTLLTLEELLNKQLPEDKKVKIAFFKYKPKKPLTYNVIKGKYEQRTPFPLKLTQEKPRKVYLTLRVYPLTYRKFRDLIQSEVVKSRKFKDVDEFVNYLIQLYKKHREF